MRIQLEITAPPIAPDRLKYRDIFSPEEKKDLSDGDGYRSRHRRADRLAELIEADSLDPDEENPLRRLFRIKAPSDFDRFAHPDTMAADRTGLTSRDGLPVEDVDRSGSSPQLHGVDHYQQVLAVDLFKEIDPAQAQENQARSTRERNLFKTGMDSLSRPVIGNEIVADAEDESGGHPIYWRGLLKAIVKVQDSPVATVFGRAGHPASSARIPAT